MTGFGGIYPALLTPFDENGGIVEREIADLILYNLQKGVSGFYVGGSTAEAFLLTHEERLRVFDVAAEAANEKCTLIAHVGSVSTDESVAFTRHAASRGYRAVSSVAPFYYRFSPREIRAHYDAIADASALPVIVYNIPAFSGVQFSFEDFASYFSDPRYAALKHTSTDFFLAQRIKSAFPDVSVLNGYDEAFLAGVATGLDGGIGSTYNFMAEKFIAIYRCLLKGRLAEARAIQDTVNQIIAALMKVGVMAGEKEVLNQLGFHFGSPRRPFAHLTSEQKDIVAREILPRLREKEGGSI